MSKFNRLLVSVSFDLIISLNDTTSKVEEYISGVLNETSWDSPYLTVTVVLISSSIDKNLPSLHLSSLLLSLHSSNVPPGACSFPHSLFSFVHKKNTSSSPLCFSFSFCFRCCGVSGRSALLAFFHCKTRQAFISFMEKRRTQTSLACTDACSPTSSETHFELLPFIWFLHIFCISSPCFSLFFSP